MTLSTTINRMEYNGDGVTEEFPYTFLVLESAHLLVYLDGVLQSGGYTVTGLKNPAGGLVDFDSPPPAGTGNIVFLRQVPLQQLVDYEEYDPFPAETHEGALDYAMMVAQQQQEELDRTLRWSVTGEDPGELQADFPADPAQRAGDIWAFDSTGTKVTNIDTAEDKAYRWAETGACQRVAG